MKETLKTNLFDKEFFFLAISPLLILSFVLIFASSFLSRDSQVLFGKDFQISTFYLVMTFFTNGHICAALFRGLAVSNIRAATYKKTLVASAIAFLLIPCTDVGFYYAFIIGIFWIHYHYFRQHFGVLRALTPREEIQNSFIRISDNFFCTTIYLVPILAFAPQNFDPAAFRQFYNYTGWNMGGTTESVFAFFITGARTLLPFFIGFWLVYVSILIWRSLKFEKLFKKTVFSFSLMTALYASWAWLDPILASVSSVTLHSFQYYFIVGADLNKHYKEKFWVPYLPLVVCFFPGILFFFFTANSYFTHGGPLIRALAGLNIAMNLVHFYMDSYIWKRPALVPKY